MKKIVCVCRGNIVRSPFAEKIIAQEIAARGLNKEYSVLSRGYQGTMVDPEPVKYPNITYYPTLYEHSKAVMDKFNVDLSRHESKPIDYDVAKNADILLAMDQKTKSALTTLFPDQADKVHILTELVNETREIVDPEGVEDAEKQKRILTEVHDAITRGFPKLLEMT